MVAQVNPAEASEPAAVADDGESASILVVDDRPESLIAIDAALKSLNQHIVKAASGPEALRHLLRQDFALILLDVNMPRMDGFETAAMIRSRRRSAHTPIIFITAYANDMHIARGYSLGAVDYILSPVVPEVLRSKVAVFVDLYRKNAQISRQAALLGERAVRQRRLTDASLAIHSASCLGELLEVIATTAAELVEARWACVTTSAELRGNAERSAAWIDGRLVADPLRAGSSPCSLSELAGCVLAENQPVRAANATVELTAFADNHAVLGDVEPAVSGWIGVPLCRRDGSSMGLIQVAGRLVGDLDDEDQAVLVQLTHISSIAIENCLLAEEREANQLKDEFLATLSHELRTPLNSILGWLHLLEAQDAGKSPQIAEGLAVIERSVHAQNRLIEDLLDVSRIARGQLRFDREPVDLALVLRTAINAAKPAAAKKDIVLALEGDDIDSQTLGDADRMQQIFGNLLSNAIKFTPCGGHVQVRVETGTDKAWISVIDSGEGIAPEFMPHIFQRFRQADHGHTRRFSGLGIGLTIVKHLVEAHDGTVRLQSEGQGHGTTALVELPLLPQEADSPTAKSATPDVVDRSCDLAGLRVLVVDDQADARDVAARILQRSGAEVVGVSSAAEALSLIQRTAPDLIISDLAMPGESGFSLIARVRQLPSPLDRTPAIALSALVGPDNSAEAISAGFQVHAAKPCDPEHLVSLAARLTAGRLRAMRERGGVSPQAGRSAG